MPPPKTVRIALIESDPHYRLFLEATLSTSRRHQLVRAASTFDEARAWPAEPAPDIILLEIGGLPAEGAAIVQELSRTYPHALTIILTSREDDDAILATVRAGAVGYVLKQGGRNVIFDAIDDALSGGSPLSPRIARRLMLSLRAPAGISAPPFTSEPPPVPLSPREIEMLTLVARGATDKQIGEHLGLSRSTVKNAMLSVYGKWRVRTRTEAAIKFLHYHGSTPPLPIPPG